MKYWAVASVMIFGDEVLSLIAITVLLFMWLIDIAKEAMKESEK